MTTYHDDELLPDLHPTVLASNQVTDAIAHLERHPSRLVRWPYPDLDAMTGPMGEGEVWFVCAYSGAGKTTFVASTIEAWRAEGKKVYVMPLELEPHRFRTYLACMSVGTHPGDALSGALRADDLRKPERDRVKAALMAQVQDAYTQHVMVSATRAINVAGLERGLMEAKAFGADVVIVDHIDHIDGSDTKGSMYEASKLVNHAALRMAQDNGLLLVFTSQLNMEIGKADRLAKYAPAQPHHVLFPSTKLQVATGMLGLFRPLRQMRDDETDKEYASMLKSVRTGEKEGPDALEPGVVGVNAMKLRNYGAHEGKRVTLGFQQGRVVPLPERHKFSTTYDGQRRIA